MKTNDFLLFNRLSLSFYYGGYAVIDETKHTLNEAEDFPSPEITLFSKLYFCDSGSYNATLDNKPITVKEGDFLIIPSGTQFNFEKPSKEFSQYWIHFNITLLNKTEIDFFSLFNFNKQVHITQKREINNIIHCFKEITELFPAKDNLDKFTTQTDVFYLISLFFKLSKTNANAEDNSFISDVNLYISNNIQSNIGLNSMAESLHISKPHLIRLIKKETGLTPLQYIINKKLELARGLLDSTNLPIKTIMYQIGFFDANSFSRTFKKYAGCSPSKYRIQNRYK